ncbi:hypothetical protein NSPZN2_40206 [Nitrospira defluvii]|uniref:Uncharacterized protein n=1 Tax=Nitrospira defluvii TaxID=330214 RepID=A0ABM8RSL5_9BACT|nr:hypothetical protein NSPZN2_40206 [Nitrospira defluvii]
MASDAGWYPSGLRLRIPEWERAAARLGRKYQTPSVQTTGARFFFLPLMSSISFWPWAPSRTETGCHAQRKDSLRIPSPDEAAKVIPEEGRQVLLILFRR